MRSPILKALSSMRKNGVATLLMGGQACVFCGAAEFSRDLDLLILTDPGSLNRLEAALAELDAVPIAVPPLGAGVLDSGHAVHYRCRRPDVSRLRIDLMSRLRGMSSFGELWDRRTTLETEGEIIEMLGLEDLILAKKTQRDKDWPMIRRLVEQSYFSDAPAGGRAGFWLRELRTPELLIEAARAYPREAEFIAEHRPAAAAAIRGELDDTAAALANEEREEKIKDRAHWEPLRRELERFRLQHRSASEQ